MTRGWSVTATEFAAHVFGTSKSEARRLIESGGFYLLIEDDWVRIESPAARMIYVSGPEAPESLFVRRGKRDVRVARLAA